MATGFGDWKLDLESVTTDGTEWTSARWTQYVVAEYHQGMPHDWQYPRWVKPYTYGWVPTYINFNGSGRGFYLINVGGATNAAILTAAALLATLAAITN